MIKLSVVLAVRNEAENIGRCLESVQKMMADLPAQAGEIVVVDEHSNDKTREIAEEYGAKVYLEPHHDIFHITKQKALDYASGEWILQLDADEVVTDDLAKEVLRVVNYQLPITNYQSSNTKLFQRHQEIIEKRDGKIGKTTGEVVGYFIPRLNMFLGNPLIHGGVYPDAAIRLIKKGKARFPQKSVHEQMKIDGRVGWLNNHLEHHDSPTLSRYFMRMNRYTDLHASELKSKKISRGMSGFITYLFWKPFITFMKLYFRHKGFLDGYQGFLWSFFSALHFPIAYFKYMTDN